MPQDFYSTYKEKQAARSSLLGFEDSGVGDDDFFTSSLGGGDSVVTVPGKPQWGWRGKVAKVWPWITKSVDEQKYDEAVRVLNQPLERTGVIAVVSHKGGVGKTTLVVLYANIIAVTRNTGKILIIEAAPGGTLAQRFTREPVGRRNSRALQDRIDAANRDGGAEVSLPEAMSFTVHNKNRVSVLVHDPNPLHAPLSADELRGLIDLFSREFDVIIVDCEQSVSSVLTEAAVERAGSVVAVADNTVSGVKGLLSYLGWQKHVFPQKAGVTQPVVNYRSFGSFFDAEQVQFDLAKRGYSGVLFVPSDEHLAEGRVVDVGCLPRGKTRFFIRHAAHVFAPLVERNTGGGE